MEKVTDYVEDRAVQHDEPLLDRFVADGLRDERLADSRRAQQPRVAGFADEAAGGPVKELLLGGGGVESPNGVRARVEVAGHGRFHASAALAFLTHEQGVPRGPFEG